MLVKNETTEIQPVIFFKYKPVGFTEKLFYYFCDLNKAAMWLLCSDK